MRIRSLTRLVGVITLSLLGMGAAGPVHRPSVLVVHPGESIQRAVDRARPGDTVAIERGVYHESVVVTVDGLTLRGAGPGTVITRAEGAPKPGDQIPGGPQHEKPGKPGKPGKPEKPEQPGKPEKPGKQKPGKPAAPAPRPGRPGRSADGADAETVARNACLPAGHGICVLGTPSHRITDVRIVDLTVTGFAKDGIRASETDGLVVRKVVARDNGEHGIAQERSFRGLFEQNTATGNVQSGIMLANTMDTEAGALDTRGTLVRDNRLGGNRMGLVLRRLRDLTAAHNTVTGNCGGIFVVGDENTPRGGALAVRDNEVVENNKYCPATQRLPYVQGTGILLTGVEQTWVEGNRVRDNRGGSPLSGGIVLFGSMVHVPNTANVITGNALSGNDPADLVNREPGNGNAFQNNACRTSQPGNMC